jgi:hypothetical protein
MVCYLETFATWLRQDMALSDDTEITIDRAAMPKDQKKIPTTRWDTLAKQQSFTMPKVPSRRRLGATIEEDTATQSSLLPARMINHTSTPKRGMVKQASLSSLPPRRTNFDFHMVRQTNSLNTLPRQSGFNSLTKDEQRKMPRLVKQRSFSSLKRGLCDEDQSIGSRPCMNKENSFSLPYRPSLPHQSCVSSARPETNHIPKLPVRTDDSDETTDTLSSMPRLVKQTSFTVARLSSREPLMGDDEKGGNGTDERRSPHHSKGINLGREIATSCGGKNPHFFL